VIARIESSVRLKAQPGPSSEAAHAPAPPVVAAGHAARDALTRLEQLGAKSAELYASLAAPIPPSTPQATPRERPQSPREKSPRDSNKAGKKERGKGTPRSAQEEGKSLKMKKDELAAAIAATAAVTKELQRERAERAEDRAAARAAAAQKHEAAVAERAEWSHRIEEVMGLHAGVAKLVKDAISHARQQGKKEQGLGNRREQAER
jgi:hypothetical protein